LTIQHIIIIIFFFFIFFFIFFTLHQIASYVAWRNKERKALRATKEGSVILPKQTICAHCNIST
jgi:uncharacterized protein HemY